MCRGAGAHLDLLDPRGRFTVPVLYDKKERVIVNNESSEILRIFNSQFNHLVRAWAGVSFLAPAVSLSTSALSARTSGRSAPRTHR